MDNLSNTSKLSNLSFTALCDLCIKLGQAEIDLWYMFDYKFFDTVRKEVSLGTVKGKWRDSMEETPGPAPDIMKESTYSGCLDFAFRPAEKILKVTMWDGDSFRGGRERVRCSWDIVVNDSMTEVCKEICSFMVDEITKHAKKQYEKAMEKQKLIGIDSVIGEYLQ